MKSIDEYMREEELRILASDSVYKDACYYTERKNCVIDDHMIFYESFFGRGLICNPYALFEYMLHDDEFRDYTHVWSAEENEINALIKEEYRDHPNVIFVTHESPEYFKYINTAKYLITNVTFRPYFSKKDGQVIINTWHGIPLKKMGYEEVGGSIKSANMARNFLMSDYILSESKYTTDIFRRAYKLENLYEGKILECGSPRIDFLLAPDEEKVRRMLARAGIETDPDKKIALYAPTFKGDYENPQIDEAGLEELLASIQKSLGDEYQLLFKPHQIVYQHLVSRNICKSTYIPAYFEVDTILALTDLLITDYSSVFFDYLVTGRDVVFYVPDYEQYRKERGVYMTLDDLPGPVCHDLKELGEVLGDPESIGKRFDRSNYDSLRQILAVEDGHTCRRVIDAVFHGDDKYALKEEHRKKRILFHTDIILKNGISSSAENLLNLIDTDKYDITFFAIGDIEEVAEYVVKLPQDIRVLYRAHGMPADAEDSAKKEYCLDNAIVRSDGNGMFPHYLYETEWKRCFGDCRFDAVINFSGFSAYCENVLLSEKNAEQIIWMHNVMMQEYKREANGQKVFERSLNNIFKMYEDVDLIVSCSHSAMLQNREDLAKETTYSKFEYLHNTINTRRIEAGLKAGKILEKDGRKYLVIAEEHEKYTCVRCPDEKDITFVTMGRLAEAKNQRNLIRAFAKFHEEHKDSALYIIGDGPLAKEYADEISRLGLADCVTITGSISNPFSLMEKCSCFILPSLYEGQPMVLLEARALRLPIIVSDFSTVADSIFPEGQLMISTDVDDILSGMQAFSEGRVPNNYRFDPEEYNSQIIEKLYSFLDRKEEQA